MINIDELIRSFESKSTNRKERYNADFTGRYRSGNFRDLGFNEVKPFISNDYFVDRSNFSLN